MHENSDSNTLRFKKSLDRFVVSTEHTLDAIKRWGSDIRAELYYKLADDICNLEDCTENFLDAVPSENEEIDIQIVLNVLHEPLLIPEEKQRISMLEAARRCLSDKDVSKLRALLMNYVKDNLQTQVLIEDLKEISCDINSSEY